ncbi:hypothetical protein BT69DRAFT_1347725 [Atractiella rhizophila]|nr:hypothetical protein BT69DRAFT_1347725 [Atractiella rhizophila]
MLSPPLILMPLRKSNHTTEMSWLGRMDLWLEGHVGVKHWEAPTTVPILALPPPPRPSRRLGTPPNATPPQSPPPAYAHLRHDPFEGLPAFVGTWSDNVSHSSEDAESSATASDTGSRSWSEAAVQVSPSDLLDSQLVATTAPEISTTSSETSSSNTTSTAVSTTSTSEQLPTTNNTNSEPPTFFRSVFQPATTNHLEGNRQAEQTPLGVTGPSPPTSVVVSPSSSAVVIPSTAASLEATLSEHDLINDLLTAYMDRGGTDLELIQMLQAKKQRHSALIQDLVNVDDNEQSHAVVRSTGA